MKQTSLREWLEQQNLLWWYNNMAIECPRFGWIDSNNDYCSTCGSCILAKK